jgi:SAM-dependent methyltransferase
MTAFGDYARFYDLLYGDKDYQAETAFLVGLLRRWAPAATSVLEIGCGSGRHGLCMAEAGFRVTGIDLSGDMVALARNRAAAAPGPVRERMAFEQGDIRSVRLGRTFPAAMALFHVVSYLATDADLHSGLACIREHLEPGGVFVFDFWHAPAVRAEGPQRRNKVAEADGWRIHRRTEPVWERDRDIVRVVFHVTATNTIRGEVRKFKEEHVMRYFSPADLATVLAAHGFAELECGEWPTGAPARDDTFGVYIVARAV